MRVETKRLIVCNFELKDSHKVIGNIYLGNRDFNSRNSIYWDIYVYALISETYLMDNVEESKTYQNL